MFSEVRCGRDVLPLKERYRYARNMQQGRGISMICRVAIHEQSPGSISSDEARSFREWIKGQPGFVGGYHAQDSQTLKSVSITVWDSKESMATNC